MTSITTTEGILHPSTPRPVGRLVASFMAGAALATAVAVGAAVASDDDPSAPTPTASPAVSDHVEPSADAGCLVVTTAPC